MKKFMTIALMGIIACVMVACSSGNSPKGTVEKYTEAIIKGDYRTALEQVAFKGTPEEVAQKRERYATLCEDKVKNGQKDKDKLVKYEITDEQIDEENGTATVTATLTYADDHTKEDTMKLIKDEDGKWLIDAGK